MADDAGRRIGRQLAFIEAFIADFERAEARGDCLHYALAVGKLKEQVDGLFRRSVQARSDWLAQRNRERESDPDLRDYKLGP